MFIMILVEALLIAGCTKEKDNGDIILTSGDWVDLGLPSGLLWATRNVGASSPTDYGDYFAWGETTYKIAYDWSVYRYCNGKYDRLIKYCNIASYGYDGYTDNLYILQPDDDAATTNYGGRIPTKEEWRELIDNTTSQWTSINGVDGSRFTGSNGNSIFLPAAGYHHDNYYNGVGSDGYYWSSSLYTLVPYCAHCLHFGLGYRYWFGAERKNGCFVRAVRSAR